MNQYISVRSVVHSLKEHAMWAFCGALSTAQPVAVGPNLRLLPGTVLAPLKRSDREQAARVVRFHALKEGVNR